MLMCCVSVFGHDLATLAKQQKQWYCVPKSVYVSV